MTPETSHVARRASRGRVWVLAGRLVQTGLTFASFVVLARLLDPADFGICAMVLVPAELAKSLVELGLPVAVVQRERWTHAELSEVFWRHLPRVAVGSAVLVAIAPLLTLYFGQDGLLALMLPLAGGVALSGLAVVPTGLVRRRLQFGAAVGVAVVATAAAFAVAVLLAYRGAGVWSLVVQVGLTWALEAVGHAGLARWWPERSAARPEVADAVRFGGGFTAAKVLRQSVSQFDRWAVGGLVGPGALGFYQQAFRWAWTPQERILAALLNVDVSAFSRLRADPAALRAQVRAAFALPYALLIPGALFGLALAPRLVVALFGAEWSPAVEPFRWLLLAGLALLPVQLAQAIFLAQGRAGAWLRWSCVEAPVLGAAVLAAALVDVAWVAPAVAASRVALLGPALFTATAGGPLRPRDVVAPALWPLLGSAVGLAGVFGLEAGLGVVPWPAAAALFGGLYAATLAPGPLGAAVRARYRAASRRS